MLLVLVELLCMLLMFIAGAVALAGLVVYWLYGMEPEHDDNEDAT